MKLHQAAERAVAALNTQLSDLATELKAREADVLLHQQDLEAARLSRDVATTAMDTAAAARAAAATAATVVSPAATVVAAPSSTAAPDDSRLLLMQALVADDPDALLWF